MGRIRLPTAETFQARRAARSRSLRTEMEVWQVASETAVSTDGHVDGPELRTQIRSMMKEESPAQG